MGREVGGGFRMGNTCTPMADSCQCMAKPLQYCKVISLQLNKIFKKKKKEAMVCHFQDKVIKDCSFCLGYTLSYHALRDIML